MKKSLLLAIVALPCMGVLAAPRHIQAAQELAEQYLGAHSDTRYAPSAQVPVWTHAYTALRTTGEPAFYVFNRGENEGFVMVSADDRTYTILGYSEKGHWDATTLPANMQAWTEGYAHAISTLDAASGAYTVPAQTKTYTPVAPICKTQWGQREPYNSLTPLSQGSHTLTGCVATAASQLMKVHQYPSQGTGSNAYKWATDNGDSIVLSADFSTARYTWSDMLDTYSESATDAQVKAVSKIMSHCGIACNMNYGASNSSANSKQMVRAMMEHFGYDKGVRVLFKDYAGDETVTAAIAEELKAGRPVYISAKTVRNEGHAFICDGMDASGFLHINWGWFGKSDGYFRLSAFNPQQQGDGGSKTNRGYTQRVQVFTHIQPDQNGEYYPSLTCDNIRMGQAGYALNEKVRFILDTLYNRGFDAWTGNLVLVVYKNGEFYKRRTIEDNVTLNSGKYKPQYAYNASFASYPKGDYEVEIAARVDGSSDSYPVYSKWLGSWRCGLKVTSDSVFVTVPEVTVPEIPEVADPEDYEFDRLGAYYYPSKSTKNQYRWKLQLATEGFFTNNPDDDSDQILLLYHVYGYSPNSILGEYVADKQALYHCISAIHYHGNAADTENLVTTDAEQGACMVSYNPIDNMYIVWYQIRLYGIDYEGYADIPLSRTRAYYGEDYGTHKKGDRISLEESALELVGDEKEHPVRKILRNGQLFILRHGETYTPQGVRVSN